MTNQTYQLVIGNKNYSTWSLRAWLACRLAELDFEEISVDMSASDFPQSAYAYSGAGKVPILLSGQQAIWDSLAIAEYAAEQQPSLWPEDPVSRALARSVSAEMHSGFSALRAAMPMNIRATGRQIALTPAIRKDIGRIDEIFTMCITHSGGPYLFGAQPTIADCCYAPVISRLVTYGMFDDASLSLSPALVNYRSTLAAWELFQAWTADACEETAIVIEDEAGEQLPE